ncbi:hypothetical protein B0G74_4247 [Paraburkholderia sp. BL9I2N2]|jgi:hypothetical protein|nr:hypothetical protein B0G74_4247 [Paraburkholderia sp. BL9I2N2]
MRRLSAASNLAGGQDDAECFAGRLVYTPNESMH